MHKVNDILLNITILFLSALMSVSCLLEKEGPEADIQSVMIQISISAGELTRTVPTDEEMTINTVRIYAYYGDRLAGYLLRQETSAGDPFYMDLQLPESGIHDVRFYIIANEGQMFYENRPVVLSENMTMDQLEAIRFSSIAGSSVLPMYCVKTESINVDAVTDVPVPESGHDGHFVLAQKVRFSLTRSVAKLSVYAAKTPGSSDPSIRSIRLLASGTREYSYLFDQNDEKLGAIPSGVNDRIFLSSDVNVSKEVVKGSQAAQNPDNYDYITGGHYIAETACGSDVWNVSSGDRNEAVIHVEYSVTAGGPLKNAYIYLPRIVRNTHFKVNILINAEGQIIVDYVVADWEDNVMSDIRFDYPTHSYLRHNVPVSQEDLASSPSGPAQMSETAPFVGYFQMTYPENDAWTPTLIGLNASECTLNVYDYTGQVEVPNTQWPIQASDEWYMVTVRPKTEHIKPGDEVMLAISYRATGFENIEYMMINGSESNFYWPYAGTSLQDADYVIITMVN